MAKVVATMMGPSTVERYQLSPTGVARVQQTGLPRGTDAVTRRVLSALVKLGGQADDDELKLAARINPISLKVALRRLVDMGIVIKVGVAEGVLR